MSCFKAEKFVWKKVSEEKLVALSLSQQMPISAQGTGGLFFITQVTISNVPYLQFLKKQDNGAIKYDQVPAMDGLISPNEWETRTVEIFQEDRQDGKLVVLELVYEGNGIFRPHEEGSLKYQFFIPRGSIASGYNISP